MSTPLGFEWASFHRMLNEARRVVRPGSVFMTIACGEYVEVIGHPYGTINRWRHDNDNSKRVYCLNGLEHGSCVWPACVSSCPGRIESRD